MSKTRKNVLRCPAGRHVRAPGPLRGRPGGERADFLRLPAGGAAALLFGPVDAVIVAMVGEFFKQLLTYGVTYTTVLYLIPPALRGLVVGLGPLRCCPSGASGWRSGGPCAMPSAFWRLSAPLWETPW